MTEPVPTGVHPDYVHPDEYEPKDRTGYEILERGGTDLLGRPAAVTYSLIRKRDMQGLGAYSTQQDIDLVIDMDRKNLAAQEQARVEAQAQREAAAAAAAQAEAEFNASQTPGYDDL